MIRPLGNIFWRMVCVLGGCVLYTLPFAETRVHAHPGAHWDLHYAKWGSVRIANSTEEATQGANTNLTHKTLGLEVVWSRVGVGYAYGKASQKSPNAMGEPIEEDLVNKLIRVSLYSKVRDMGGGSFFLGTGIGETNYGRRRNGRIDSNPDLHHAMSTRSFFAGWQYRWKRLGIRAEFNRQKAVREFAVQRAVIERRIRSIGVFIPFN